MKSSRGLLSLCRESNPRPRSYQERALPTELQRRAVAFRQNKVVLYQLFPLGKREMHKRTPRQEKKRGVVPRFLRVERMRFAPQSNATTRSVTSISCRGNNSSFSEPLCRRATASMRRANKSVNPSVDTACQKPTSPP